MACLDSSLSENVKNTNNGSPALLAAGSLLGREEQQELQGSPSVQQLRQECWQGGDPAWLGESCSETLITGRDRLAAGGTRCAQLLLLTAQLALPWPGGASHCCTASTAGAGRGSHCSQRS